MGDDALRPALELWSYVQSIPEPGLALLTFGRRDASYDHGYPVPLKLARAGSATVERLDGCAIRAMNDQHAYLATPPDVGIRVGDRVILGISHPCTAFDKWRIVLVVDDEENVVDAVLTFF
jgi:D-serine dehydratase